MTNLHIKIFDSRGQKLLEEWDDGVDFWPNEENLIDHVLFVVAPHYSDNVVEVDDGSLKWRFRTGRMAGQTSVRRIKPPKSSRATRFHNQGQLNEEWIKDKNGVIVNDLEEAKKYAQARADYHGVPQIIYEGTRYNDEWLVQPWKGALADAAAFQRYMTVHPGEQVDFKKLSQLKNKLLK